MSTRSKSITLFGFIEMINLFVFFFDRREYCEKGIVKTVNKKYINLTKRFSLEMQAIYR